MLNNEIVDVYKASSIIKLTALETLHQYNNILQMHYRSGTEAQHRGIAVTMIGMHCTQYTTSSNTLVTRLAKIDGGFCDNIRRYLRHCNQTHIKNSQ